MTYLTLATIQPKENDIYQINPTAFFPKEYLRKFLQSSKNNIYIKEN